MPTNLSAAGPARLNCWLRLRMHNWKIVDYPSNAPPKPSYQWTSSEWDRYINGHEPGAYRVCSQCGKEEFIGIPY